jgi:SAM-dependent methyltransferase
MPRVPRVIAAQGDHDRELAAVRALWVAQQAHLRQVPDGERQLHYLRKHLDYEPQVRRHLRAVDRMAPYVHGRVLEWGCRHAPDSAVLTMRLGDSIECHGADLFTPGIFRPFHDRSSLAYRQLDDPVALPYDNEQFDTVIAHGVLEHVPDPDGSLGELRRIMKPGATLVIDALPNRYCYTEAWLRATGGPAHKRRYTLATITAALTHHGYRILDLRKVGLLPGMLNRRAPRLRDAYAKASRQIHQAESLLERSPASALAASLFVAAERR